MNNQKTEYKLEGGSIITATSPTDFITQLRESSKFDSQCTDQEYMINFAKRREVQTGAIIRTDSPDNFVKDLMDTGYIE